MNLKIRNNQPVQKEETTDDKKISSTVDKIMNILNKNKLSISELIVLYGNLGYHIGASIAGFQDKGPDIETLKREYYRNPTIDVGLMLQGLIITTWEADFLKKPILSILAPNNKEEK